MLSHLPRIRLESCTFKNTTICKNIQGSKSSLGSACPNCESEIPNLGSWKERKQAQHYLIEKQKEHKNF